MTPEIVVEELIGVLAQHRIGAVVVSRDGVTVEGIVSERDVVRALAERGTGVLGAPVAEIQTTQVRTVAPEAQLEDVERLMTERRFRHVPVVVDGRLSGVVSIGDVVKHRIDELETERSTLADYITGERS
ncbi:CBS domain-containing protein [Actinoplanes sp. NPDC051851]|uniref:CBS domain-containing protein n=1 Tax=Actinoplanes sp. NPDC051851 TaxID=3154753 RepID=UPI00343C9BDB